MKHNAHNKNKSSAETQKSVLRVEEERHTLQGSKTPFVHTYFNASELCIDIKNVCGMQKPRRISHQMAVSSKWYGSIKAGDISIPATERGK